MTDLADFIRARLDEDEQTARAAKPGPWRVEEGRRDLTRWVANEERSLEIALGYVGNRTQDDAAHIARHDPARVLREVKAKRQMLGALESAEVALRNTESSTELSELMTGARNSLRAVVRMHAAVYDDHPDYREEWRP